MSRVGWWYQRARAWWRRLVGAVPELGSQLARPGEHLSPVIELVRSMSAVDYARVQFEQREAIHRAFAEVFLEHDLLIWPTTPMTAFPHPRPVGGPTVVDGQEVRYPPLQNQRYTEAIAARRGLRGGPPLGRQAPRTGHALPG